MVSSSTPPILILAASVASLAVALWAWQPLEPDSSPGPAASNPGAEAQINLVPLPAAASGTATAVEDGKDTQSLAEVTALRREVALLRGDLTVLRTQIQAQAAQISAILDALPSDEVEPLTASEGPMDPEDAEAWEATLIEQEQQLSLLRAQTNEAEFASEPVDTSWAAEANSLIQNAFTSEELKATGLTDVQCRSTLCRMEVLHEDANQHMRFEHRFPLMVAELLPSIAMQTIENDNGSSSTIVYLARDGHLLPQDELLEFRHD